MISDLHKRLEEAANGIYPISESYNDLAMEFVDTNSGLREAFKDGGEVGIELGYKEAIARAKEYLENRRDKVRMEIEKCTPNTVREYSLVMVREHLDEIINELFKEENK